MRAGLATMEEIAFIELSPGSTNALTGFFKFLPPDFLKRVAPSVWMLYYGKTTTPAVVTPQPTEKNCEACDGTTIDLQCPEGEVIDLTEVFYGRDDATNCPGPMASTSCSSDTFGTFVGNQCEGQQVCSGDGWQ